MLWDLDGTLADSREYHWLSWRETMGADGVHITHGQFLATFGQRNDAILTGWLGGNATASLIRRLGDAKEERFRELVRRDGLVPLPGAAAWIARLANAGWRQAIASSAPRANVETMVAALGFAEVLGTFVGAEDVTRGKPDPEVFLTAAERVAVPPARCVVVEDAAAGIEAARRARMANIGLGVPGADLTVPSLDAVPDDAFDQLVKR